jgi:hypothetical protein
MPIVYTVLVRGPAAGDVEEEEGGPLLICGVTYSAALLGRVPNFEILGNLTSF